MAGCDGVFHLAASVGGTIEATREFNTEGTRRVLRAAKLAAKRGWLELPLPVNLGVSAKMARQRTRIPATALAACETAMGLQAGCARR